MLRALCRLEIFDFDFPMPNSLLTLKSAIERLSALETIVNPDEARPAFFDFRAALTRGEVRAAEKVGGRWVVSASYNKCRTETYFPLWTKTLSQPAV
jgi:hypothetical protein